MSDLSTPVVRLPEEQQALRAKCFHPSGTFVPFESKEIEQSIPDRFEKIVAKYPDRIAIQTKDQTVSYEALNRMANRTARVILTRQGSKGGAVGLFLAKGAPLIAAMLGVLKSGKFFVLLDPSFPRARVSAILEDSEAGLMITDRQNLFSAGQIAGDRCQIMDFDAVDREIPEENLSLCLSPKDPAFILYTSGSTGQPKGIVWMHQNQLHQAMAYTNAYRVCEEDRITLLTSGTANAVTTTFLALLNGAALFPFEV